MAWLESLLSELGVLLKAPPVLRCDNVGTTYLATNTIFHARTKHVEIDFHIVQEKVANGALDVQFILSKD